MTPDQIAQLRQILKNIVIISNTEPHVVSDAVNLELANQALALLPCETCNDVGEVVRTFSASLGFETPWRPKDSIQGSADEIKPCPNCR